MTCDNYRELMSADLDGELQADEEVDLFAHLGACAECRQWRRDQLALRTEFQQWPQEELPTAIASPPSGVITVVRNVYRIPRVLAWAAAAIVLVQSAVTVSYLSRSTEPPVAYEDVDEEADTITLTAEDRTRYTVQTLPAITRPTDPSQNGG